MTQMELIKNELSEHIGKRVIIKANRGRKRIVTRKGILKAVYPSLFVVTISSDGMAKRNISFTYSDVLTSTVKIAILEEDVDIADLKIS
ncbi:MAG: Veg family protein [Peptoniphilus sp.]|nr:Veg family protein [Peptoniphilus sp.]MDD7362590.1 Veg family protein [Bacillota bacterium]MDY6045011.1 Veg family protein [Peptoniphilus sp.]